MVSPQKDYQRYPAYTRGKPEDVARWKNDTERGRYALRSSEIFWRDIQPFLLERGYKLRPRFTPDWKPSWIGTDINPIYMDDVDSVPLPSVIDAQTLNESLVAIKWIPDAEHTRNELDILRFLSSDQLRTHPRNRACPLLDSFPHPNIPNGVFAVFPWLGDMIPVPLHYVHDVADMMLQTFEGLSFLHENGVAHRDCTGANIMVEYRTLFPAGARPRTSSSC